MSEFSHLKNKLLAEQVEDEIYHYILDTPLEPGTKLPFPARASWRCGAAPAPMWSRLPRAFRTR